MHLFISPTASTTVVISRAVAARGIHQNRVVRLFFSPTNSYLVVVLTRLWTVYVASVKPLLAFSNYTEDVAACEPLSDHSHSCALWSNTLVMIGFALLHSILARSKTFKQLAGNYHRSLYNLASCSYLLGAGLIWYPTPTHVMWEFPLSSDWVLQLFVAVHAISWGLVGLSLLTYNHTELLGLPQTLYGSDPLKAQGESLQRLYSHMRHPLLALPCLLLWAVPVMTLDRMLLGAFLPLYLLWGCGLDEVDSAYARRQLMRKFNKICCDVPDKDQ